MCGIAGMVDLAGRRPVPAGILAAIPLDMLELVRPIGIIHRRQKLLTPTADKLLDFLQSQKH